MSNPKSNENFSRILSSFGTSLDTVSKLLSNLDEIHYDDLSTENKIRYDLFVAYSMNGLMWEYLRTVGEEPAQTVIKIELNRVKDFMSELQYAIDRKSIVPTINEKAAKRSSKNDSVDPENGQPKSKLIRFE